MIAVSATKWPLCCALTPLASLKVFQAVLSSAWTVVPFPSERWMKPVASSSDRRRPWRAQRQPLTQRNGYRDSMWETGAGAVV